MTRYSKHASLKAVLRTQLPSSDKRKARQVLSQPLCGPKSSFANKERHCIVLVPLPTDLAYFVHSTYHLYEHYQVHRLPPSPHEEGRTKDIP